MFLKFGPLFVIFREPRFEIRSHYGTEIILDDGDPGDMPPTSTGEIAAIASASTGQPEPVATVSSASTVAPSPRIECQSDDMDPDMSRFIRRLEELAETTYQ